MARRAVKPPSMPRVPCNARRYRPCSRAFPLRKPQMSLKLTRRARHRRSWPGPRAQAHAIRNQTYAAEAFGAMRTRCFAFIAQTRRNRHVEGPAPNLHAPLRADASMPCLHAHARKQSRGRWRHDKPPGFGADARKLEEGNGRLAELLSCGGPEGRLRLPTCSSKQIGARRRVTQQRSGCWELGPGHQSQRGILLRRCRAPPREPAVRAALANGPASAADLKDAMGLSRSTPSRCSSTSTIQASRAASATHASWQASRKHPMEPRYTDSAALPQNTNSVQTHGEQTHNASLPLYGKGVVAFRANG